MATSTYPSKTGVMALVNSISGFVEAGSDKTYVLDEYAKFAYNIDDITIKLASGTVTVAIKINGTNVTGLSAIAATSTQATSTATAARTVNVGDKVTMVWSSSSTPVDLGFTMKMSRL